MNTQEQSELLAVSCPMCGLENLPMGQLGALQHYNCRACGAWYSKTPDTWFVRDEIDGGQDENQ